MSRDQYSTMSPVRILRRMQAKCRGRERTIRRLDSRLNRLYERIDNVRGAASEADVLWQEVAEESTRMKARIADLEADLATQKQRAEALWMAVSGPESVN